MSKRSCRFTHEWLESVSATTREVWHDDGCPNLIVRVGSGSRPSKVFYWYGRSSGKPTFVKIGTFPAMPVTKARTESKRITGLVSSGEIVRSKSAISRDELTLGLLFNWYMKFHSRPHKKTWREDERNFEKRLMHWSNVRLSKINREAVRRLHLEIRVSTPGGPYAANKMLELLGFMFRLARTELDIKADDPTEGVKRFPRVERDRFLTRDEIPKFLQALFAHPHDTTRDFILLSLLTGARRSNVCAMRWSEIDFSENVWRVSAENSKNKKPMRIVLSADAIEILNRRKENSTTQWVLPSHGPTGHITDPKYAMRAILIAAGISREITVKDRTGKKRLMIDKENHVRFHDLRRTLGSWQAAQGTSLLVIGKTLGHSSPSATRVYARLDLDPVRESVEQASASLMASRKIK